MLKKTIWQIAVSLLAVACLGLAVPGFARDEGSFDRTLKVTGPVELDVSTGAGDITVQAGASSEVRVHAVIKANNAWFSGSNDAETKIHELESNPPVEQQGNYIRIGHITDPELRRGVSISYDIEAPPRTQLQASSGSGDVSADGIHGPVKASSGSGDLRIADIGDEVTASTGSGDVRARAIRGEVHISSGSGDIQAVSVMGSFYLSTGSGDIKLSEEGSQVSESIYHSGKEIGQSEATSFSMPSERNGFPAGGRVSTGSGSIQVTGVNGPLRAGTGSGDITAQGVAAGDWSLQSGSGTLIVRLPAQASFNLDAHSDSGRILTRRSVTIQGTFGKGTMRGVVGKGGPLVKLRTGSGDIEID
jgi:hypothetical protein